MRKTLSLCIAAILSFCTAFLSFAGSQDSLVKSGSDQTQVALVSSVTLIAAGDNLIHSGVYNKARIGDGQYDFKPQYAEIKDFISSYDIAVINQETIFVHDERDVSSYPCFGTPEVMGEAIVDAGFDVVLSATNHTWDKGEAGVRNTLSYWQSHYPNIRLLGIHGSQEDADRIDYYEKNGIRFAMFNYTYGMNGFKRPSDKPYIVNLLSDKDKFLTDVRVAEENADMTICFLHIGEEYVYTPTSYQTGYINELIDAGADLIICAHPHVIEPYGEITTDAGNHAVVYYSCGNLNSTQSEVPRMLGGLASVTIKKEQGRAYIKDYTFVPTVTHTNSSEQKIYLLDRYTDELAARHRLYGNGLTVAKLWALWNSILGN